MRVQPRLVLAADEGSRCCRAGPASWGDQASMRALHRWGDTQADGGTVRAGGVGRERRDEDESGRPCRLGDRWSLSPPIFTLLFFFGSVYIVLEWFVDFLHSSDYRQQITWIEYNQKFEWNIDKSHSSDKSNTTRMIHTTNLTQNRLERTSKRKFTLWN